MHGETVTGAAEALHLSRRTVQRWLTEGNFAEALEHAQGAAMSTAARRLAGKLDRAAELVVRMAESAEDEPVRLKAAAKARGARFIVIRVVRAGSVRTD